MWIAGDDRESQQKGIVFLLWPDPDITNSIKIRYPMNQGGTLIRKVFQCVPMRVAAIHFCTPDNDPFFQVLKSVFIWTLGNKRSRLRFHSGRPVELRYEIGSYGIPFDLIPLTSTGNVKTTYLKQWMRLRNTLEEGFLTGETHSTSGKWIECPGSRDVIFKPGKPIRNHLGNVIFRSIIEARSGQHKLASQTEKSEIAREVVDEMIGVRRGRFLIWDSQGVSPNGFPGCWKAIHDPHQQRQKVAISFRNYKLQRRPVSNRETTTTEPPKTASLHTNSSDDYVSSVATTAKMLSLKEPTDSDYHSVDTNCPVEGNCRKRVRTKPL